MHTSNFLIGINLFAHRIEIGSCVGSPAPLHSLLTMISILAATMKTMKTKTARRRKPSKSAYRRSKKLANQCKTQSVASHRWAKVLKSESNQFGIFFATLFILSLYRLRNKIIFNQYCSSSLVQTVLEKC